MSTNRDFDRIAGAWLAEGPSELADRVLDAALDEVHLTNQRHRRPVPWRTPTLSTPLRMAAGIAVIVILGYAGLTFLTPRTGPGGLPSPTPSPSTTVTPTPTPAPVQDVALSPGRYRLVDGGFAMSITVPAGWSGEGNWGLTKDYDAGPNGSGAGFGAWEITNRYVDACTDHTLVDPPPGPGIDELIEALASQPGVAAGPPTDVTIDGYQGTFVELTVTTDISTCGSGVDAFWLWGDPFDHRYLQGTNEMNRIYVLEVDGVRRTFFARVPERTTAADRAELEAIIGSIDIVP